MSNRFYGSMFHQDLERLRNLSRSQVLIYCALIAHGGKERRLRLSQRKIGELAGVSMGSCAKALRLFKKSGWLKTEKYYQILEYHMPSDFDDLCNSSDTPLCHSYDTPLCNSSDTPLCNSSDIDLCNSSDTHVISSNKEEDSIIHVHEHEKDKNLDSLSAKSADEFLFQRLFDRWSKCELLQWSTQSNKNPLSIWRQIKSKTGSSLLLSLELQIIDSWLLMTREDTPDRLSSWKGAWWTARIESWLQRQSNQGARKDIHRLSSRQKGFFDYAITMHSTPEIKVIVNLSSYKENHKMAKKSAVRVVAERARVQDYLSLLLKKGELNLDNDWHEISQRFKGFPTDGLDLDDRKELFRAIPALESLEKLIKIGAF